MIGSDSAVIPSTPTDDVGGVCFQTGLIGDVPVVCIVDSRRVKDINQPTLALPSRTEFCAKTVRESEISLVNDSVSLFF